MLFHAVSVWTMPLFILLILVYAFSRKVRVYEVFLQGVEDGLQVGVRLFPFLLGIFTALAVFRSSGAMDLLLNLTAPLAKLAGLPREIVPLLVLKPLSGTAALGYMGELLQKHGPDSVIGRMAAVVQGSTETTFYVLTVYLGAIGIKKPQHLLAVGLLADWAAFAAAIILVNFLCP